jgi:phospholipid/cholesterol/gamma-HCH transport system permease protein
MSGLLTGIGRFAIEFVESAGEAWLLLWRSFASLRRRPWYLRIWFQQMVEIGNRSLPVIVITAVFSGAVFALQIWEGFEQFGATTLVAFSVALAMTRELIPVLGSLMVAGRAGGAMAAEIGTMRVTEQIDAMETMATDPVKYLVVPRVIAAAVMLPVVVVIGDLLGILGGYMVSVYINDARPTAYWEASFAFIVVDDVTSGLIKASIFGVMISIFSCMRGFGASGGAQGVGRATTSAVVTSSMAILVSDFFLTKALLVLWDK